jgi:hypothetical protein
MLRPNKPDFVPDLNLDDLPAYETSSEEDEGEVDNGKSESRCNES